MTTPAVKPGRALSRTCKISPVHVAALLAVIFVGLSSTYWYTQCTAGNVSEPPVVSPLSAVSIPPLQYFNFTGVNALMPLIFPNVFAPVWEAHPHLVTIGITMRSDDKCLAVHSFHSETWASFPKVARKANGFKGLVLPLYLAEAVQTTPPYWDARVEKRLNRDGNILIFRQAQEKTTTEKDIGVTSTGTYGVRAMFAMTRKESMWFRYAYHHFRYTPFLAKADLDVYINIPAYLSVLQQLPRVSTSYGKTRPPQDMDCFYDHPFVYVIGPLYTATRDIAREVFTAPLAMRVLSAPRNESEHQMLGTFGFEHADTLHSKMLFHLYGQPGTQRAFPTQEFKDAQTGASLLPPLAGMGKLYMEQIAKETPDMPLSGTVQGLFGYSYTYNLPGPLKRTHLIFVTDNCRCRDEAFPNAEQPYSMFLHRTTTKRLFKTQHKKYNIGTNAFTKMPHPVHFEVTDHVFFYHVPLSSIYCTYFGELFVGANWTFAECWHGRPNWAKESLTQ